MFSIFKHDLSMQALFPEPTRFLLKEISTAYSYEDGKKTDKVKGFYLSIVEMKNFEKLKVLVETDHCPIPDQSLDLMEQNKVFVSFIDAYAHVYRTKDNEVATSFRAKGVKVI